jgi:hypothetical protein
MLNPDVVMSQRGKEVVTMDLFRQEGTVKREGRNGLVLDEAGSEKANNGKSRGMWISYFVDALGGSATLSLFSR